MAAIKAIVADDEAPLRAHLRDHLAAVWPELIICAETADGDTTLAAIVQHRPDIVFLDIRMPGLSGMDVARRIAGTCHIVFVTAYDQYAITAFETEAVDYMLKPVVADRLAQTVNRLKHRLTEARNADVSLAAIDRLALRIAPLAPNHLAWIRVQQKNDLKLIPVADIAYFQSQDKYTRVVTADADFVIRTPIAQLAKQLDPDRFWQIHRAVIINVSRIDRVSRSLTGRPVVRLTRPPVALTASRAYAHLFKGM